MPRPKLAEPHIDWRISIPQSLAQEVDAELLDPMRNTVKYGSRKNLIVSLLRKWVDERKANDSYNSST